MRNTTSRPRLTPLWLPHARDDSTASPSMDKGQLCWARGNYKPSSAGKEKACVPLLFTFPKKGAEHSAQQKYGSRFPDNCPTPHLVVTSYWTSLRVTSQSRYTQTSWAQAVWVKMPLFIGIDQRLQILGPQKLDCSYWGAEATGPMRTQIRVQPPRREDNHLPTSTWPELMKTVQPACYPDNPEWAPRDIFSVNFISYSTNPLKEQKLWSKTQQI